MIGVSLCMHLLELEITTRCNLNCLHCYNRGNKNMDMEYNEIIKYINFANDNNVHTFVISGGEACLHKDFGDLCNYVKKNRKKLSNVKKIIVQSNGYIGNVVDLKELTGFDYVHLSFDIDDNGLRKISSNKTIELAQNIKKAGGDVYLFTTIHKGNLNKLDDIYRKQNDWRRS